MTTNLLTIGYDNDDPWYRSIPTRRLLPSMLNSRNGGKHPVPSLCNSDECEELPRDKFKFGEKSLGMQLNWRILWRKNKPKDQVMIILQDMVQPRRHRIICQPEKKVWGDRTEESNTLVDCGSHPDLSGWREDFRMLQPSREQHDSNPSMEDIHSRKGQERILDKTRHRKDQVRAASSPTRQIKSFGIKSFRVPTARNMFGKGHSKLSGGGHQLPQTQVFRHYPNVL
ncbi:hypothetical protein Tco_1530882 [Tanacetum coccineum]